MCAAKPSNELPETARRLVYFSEPKRAEELTGEDLRRFLSYLAVKERCSGATQRQALNAGIFFIREALGRDPERPSQFAGIENLPRRVRVMPADAAQVKAFIADNAR